MWFVGDRTDFVLGARFFDHQRYNADYCMDVSFRHALVMNGMSSASRQQALATVRTLCADQYEASAACRTFNWTSSSHLPQAGSSVMQNGIYHSRSKELHLFDGNLPQTISSLDTKLPGDRRDTEAGSIALTVAPRSLLKAVQPHGSHIDISITRYPLHH